MLLTADVLFFFFKLFNVTVFILSNTVFRMVRGNFDCGTNKNILAIDCYFTELRKINKERILGLDVLLDRR